MFEYKYNPFRYDVEGTLIETKDDENSFTLPKSLMLSPDISTLKEMPWQKKEALVIADVHYPEDGKLLPYAPRNLLKHVASKLESTEHLSTQLMFSFMFNKQEGKDAKSEGGKEAILNNRTNRGMLPFEQGWGEVLSDCKQTLDDIGIPVQSKDYNFENQFRFVLRKVTNDLVGQCDMFHIAKHAIKFIAYTHDYDISSVPIDNKGITNDLIITVSGMNLNAS